MDTYKTQYSVDCKLSSYLLRSNLLNYAQSGKDYSDVNEFMRFLKNAFSDDESFQTNEFITDLSNRIRDSIQCQKVLDVSNISNILNLTNLRLILSLSAFLTESSEHYHSKCEYLNKIKSLDEEVENLKKQVKELREQI